METLKLIVVALALLIGVPLVLWAMVAATNRKYLSSRERSAQKAAKAEKSVGWVRTPVCVRNPTSALSLTGNRPQFSCLRWGYAPKAALTQPTSGD